MDYITENMGQKDMLERIAELEYNQCHLRDMNAKMKDWLDSAEEDNAVLRLENTALKKHVKDLEKQISSAERMEAEPNPLLRTDDLIVKRCTEERIWELEEESTVLKEQNKAQTSELKNVQQEREQDKISLCKLQVALKTLEFEMEVAQVELQFRDESLHQKDLQLTHLVETVEECSNVIKDLRQTNQELRERLEERQDEALLCSANELTEDGEKPAGARLSILEEIKMVPSSDVFKTHIKDEQAETGEKPQSGPQTKRRRALRTAVQAAALFLMFIYTFLFLAFVAATISSGNCHMFFLNIWTATHMMLQPYCNVYYSDLPPI